MQETSLILAELELRFVELAKNTEQHSASYALHTFAYSMLDYFHHLRRVGVAGKEVAKPQASPDV